MKKIRNIIGKVNLLCTPNNNCKIILLTCHRRENYFTPIYNIINAIKELSNIPDKIKLLPKNILEPIKKLKSTELHENKKRLELLAEVKIEENNRIKY